MVIVIIRIVGIVGIVRLRLRMEIKANRIYWIM